MVTDMAMATDMDMATMDVDGTAKDRPMLNLLPMLMLLPLLMPILTPMPMLPLITEDTMAMDGDTLMDMVIMADGTAKDRPMPNLRPMLMPKLTHTTEDTMDGEVIEDTEDTMVDIVDTTGDKNLV